MDSIATRFEAVALTYGERPALISRRETVDYAELADRVGAFRAALASFGLGPESRVGVAAGNTVEFVVAYLATNGLGAVTVPINAGAPAPEIVRTSGRARLDALFCAGEALERIDSIADLSPHGRLIVDSKSGAPTAALAVDALANRGAEPAKSGDPNAPAVIAFTAGTTGGPRGAVLTNANLLANLDQMAATPGMHVEPDDVLLGVLPMFHIAGLNVVLAGALLSGASVALVPRFDAIRLGELIAREAVTVVMGAPSMYTALLETGSLRSADFESVRLFGSGAARLEPNTFVAWRERFARPLWDTYGLTETSPVVASALAAGRAEPGRVGVEITGVEVRLVGAEGEDVDAGDAGEIVVRGANVFTGYDDDDEATGQVLRDGALWTGDVGIRDSDGLLSIVDRHKDIVIVSGFNVYPREVEEILLMHPEIADAAVVGAPDHVRGEALHAFVVAASGADLDTDDVGRHARRYLAAYKCPTRIRVVDAIPRGQIGKLVRRDLRSG